MLRRFDFEHEVYEWYHEDDDSDAYCDQRVNWAGKFEFRRWQFSNTGSPLTTRDDDSSKSKEKTWSAYFAEKSKLDCQRFRKTCLWKFMADAEPESDFQILHHIRLNEICA